jgi:hypothetical protein
MIIEPGEKYKMFVEAKGYYSQTIELDFSQNIDISDVKKTIRLTKKEAKPIDKETRE